MIWRPFLSREYVLPERVYIFDTTLRDGEQTAGVSLCIDDKLSIAEALSDIGVDIIEAGFPAVSPGELDAIKQIVEMGLRPKICVLSRCDERDIDLAANTGADWIHLFIATSDLHMKYKLRLAPEQVLSRAVEMTQYAKSYGMTVHFSAEDATRSDFDFLLKIYRSVKEAGAESIDIPDTVGIAIPYIMRNLARMIKEATGIPVAVHCHDDLGLATANTLAGVEGGAEIVHVTVNGIGERAGNASLEEVAAALRFLYGID
ncbi:MAG: 2-isopropylmalate synthase, partial [Nitrososphaerota archaeon]